MITFVRSADVICGWTHAGIGHHHIGSRVACLTSFETGMYLMTNELDLKFEVKIVAGFREKKMFSSSFLSCYGCVLSKSAVWLLPKCFSLNYNYFA